MPALLTKYLLFLIYIRIKDSIHIYMAQILKILVIAACYRIYCLIRICHCIQKCIQRSLYQFYKWVLDREFLRTAQYSMFNNVWNTCGICRWRSESNTEYLVIIIIFKQGDSCSCLLMSEQITHGMDIPDFSLLNYFICCYVFNSSVFHSTTVPFH